MSFVSRSAVASVRRPFAFVMNRNNNNMMLARPISSSGIRSKTVAESTKDTLDSVNKGLGKGLASAIETGEVAGQKVKEAVVGTSKEAKEKTEQTASSAAEKGKKAAAGAREKKDEMLEDNLVP